MVTYCRRVPVLDATLPVIYELVKNNEATIETSTQEPFVGQAIDTVMLLKALHQNLILEVERRYRGKVVTKLPELRDKKFETPPKKLYLIFDEKREFDTNLYDNLLGATLLQSSETNEKISVQARQKGGRAKSEIPCNLEELIENIKPPEKREISLRFGYMGMSDFPVDMIFEDYQNIKDIITPRAGKIVKVYPVSTRSIHLLDHDVWWFIHEPLFWDTQSQIYSQVLQEKAGCISIEDIEKCYGENRAKVYKRHRDSMNMKVFYEIIDCFIRGRDANPVTRNLGCPDVHVGYFLRKLWKTFVKIANPTTVETVYVKNLINAYNEEYASVTGRQIMTPEQLCRVELIF